jgi:hypothetical protein
MMGMKDIMLTVNDILARAEAEMKLVSTHLPSWCAGLVVGYEIDPSGPMHLERVLRSMTERAIWGQVSVMISSKYTFDGRTGVYGMSIDAYVKPIVIAFSAKYEGEGRGRVCKIPTSREVIWDFFVSGQLNAFGPGLLTKLQHGHADRSTILRGFHRGFMKRVGHWCYRAMHKMIQMPPKA